MVKVRKLCGEAYEVWISREEMVDFLLYAASLEASVATRSKMSVLYAGSAKWIILVENGFRLTIHEGVENGHGTVGDTSVGVDLLQDWIESH